jgi:hypothetical protein
MHAYPIYLTDEHPRTKFGVDLNGTFKDFQNTVFVTVEHISSPKNAMSPLGFDTGTSHTVSHHSTN